MHLGSILSYTGLDLKINFFFRNSSQMLKTGQISRISALEFWRQFPVTEHYLMCGGAVNRQPGYRARNLQRRGNR